MFGFFLVGILFYDLAFDSRLPQPWFGSEALNLLPMVVVMVLPIPVHVVGVVLGLVSLFFPSRNKLFPALAIGLNLLFGLFSLFPWLYVAWLGLHSGVK